MPKSTILIVDPYSSGKIYAAAFKQQGYDVTALLSTTDIPSFLTDSFNADEYTAVFTDIDECKCQFAEDPPVAVVSGSEIGVIVAEQLSQYFGTPGNDPQSTVKRRDKFAMQQALAHNNLNHIRTVQLTSADQTAALDSLRTPSLVVKPANGSASESVVLCRSKAQAIEAIQKFPWQQRNNVGQVNHTLLAQEFITGLEYVVDLVAFAGTYTIAAVCRYEKSQSLQGDFIYIGLDTLDPTDPQWQQLIQYAKDAAKALDFQVGPVHMEIIDSPTGPVMVEAAARLHGGIAPQLYQQCYQPHLLDLAMVAYLQPEATQLDSSTATQLGRIVFLVTPEQGLMGEIDATVIEQVQSCPSYCGHVLFHQPGDTLQKTKDLFTCPGIVWLAADNAKQIEQDEAMIRQQLATLFQH